MARYDFGSSTARWEKTELIRDQPLFRATLIVEPYLSGVRVDSFLLRHFRNYTPFRMQRMVAAGCIRRYGVALPLETRVFRGQRIDVELCEPPDKLHLPEPIPLKIAFEDPWIIVIDKPPGLIAHPVGEHQSQTLFNALQWYFDQQTPRRGLLRPGIVHRLDRMTSGLIVVAKDHLAHRGLSLDFQNNRVAKQYLAVVSGHPESDQGVITLPIGMAPGGRSVLMSCKSDALKARPAETHYEVLQRFPRSCLVKAQPQTGRNHQIRIHFAEIGHPLLGDQFYLEHGRHKPWRESLTESRHALHASRLEFAHPVTSDWLRFDSELPDDLRAMCD